MIETRKKSILIVDDDADLCEVIAEILEHSGYHTSRAHDGASACTMLRAGYLPNLILLDVGMPGMDGFRLFDELKFDRFLSQVPIVVISGTEGHPFPWVSYLKKPFDSAALMNVVGKYAR